MPLGHLSCDQLNKESVPSVFQTLLCSILDLQACASYLLSSLSDHRLISAMSGIMLTSTLYLPLHCSELWPLRLWPGVVLRGEWLPWTVSLFFTCLELTSLLPS